jgi:UMF1 family MFS transporter
MAALDSDSEAGESPARMASPAHAEPTASRLAIWGWVMFDWATQPFFTLIITFVYAPYFVSAVVGDPVRGQALWGYATGTVGLIIALFSPLLGAVADATGQRKRWIAAFGVLLVLGSWALWFGKPGDPSTILFVLVAFGIGAVGVEFATVFNNAMMPALVPHERLGRLSGLGWGMGYVGGLLSLVIALAFFASNPTTGKTILGYAPLFGLDPAMREGDRAIGPFSALWFIVFVLPLFLFTPDLERGLPLKRAVRSGLSTIKDTFAEARRHKNIGLFLLANMIYADGLVALFAFGGIYAVGTFDWSTIELGIFGILLTIAGTIGAIVGGRLDDRFGPKRVILTSLALLILASVLILSVSRDRMLFFVPIEPGGPGLFGSAAEKLYIGLGLLIGLAAGPMQAASRTLLARLSPRAQMAQFFGLFALSGKLTSFSAPLLVAAVTAATASQKAGISVLVAFFAAGALVLSRVSVSGGSGARR